MAVIFICFAVNITAVEWLFIITAIFLVLITEILNSAIEYTVDLVTGDYHILARYAKDTQLRQCFFKFICCNCRYDYPLAVFCLNIRRTKYERRNFKEEWLTEVQMHRNVPTHRTQILM